MVSCLWFMHNHSPDSDSSLIDLLHLQFPDSSIRTLKQWISHGRVLVDGLPAKGPRVPAGAELEVVKKQLAPLPVLFEDRYFVAIDKPAGLLSVPAERKNQSALSILRDYYRAPNLFAAHRLDEGASGVLLFVRGESLRERMAALFGAHELEREYHAIVEGRIARSHGMWEFPLEELENYDVHVSTSGREACTEYQCLRRTSLFSHLRIRLHTGRKHQIRVHTSYVGHPIIGDTRYGSHLNPLKRLGLHATRLAFVHPITGKTIECQAPLPKRFLRLGADLPHQGRVRN